MATNSPSRKPAAKTKAPLAVLSKEELLAREDLEEMSVEFPEWGGSLVIRQLRRSEQYQAETAATVGGEIDESLLELHTLAFALVEPSFSPAEITALGEKNGTLVGALVTFQSVLQNGGKKSLEDFIKSLSE